MTIICNWLSKHHLHCVMEFNKEYKRAIICFHWMEGLTQEQSHEKLVKVLGDMAPSRTTVFNWFAEFNRGRRSLKDEDRTGRPISATSEENVSKVRELVENDRKVTYHQIAEVLMIGNSSIQTILHDHLKLKKV